MSPLGSKVDGCDDKVGEGARNAEKGSLPPIPRGLGGGVNGGG